MRPDFSEKNGMAPLALAIEDVCFSYGSKGVLRDVSFGARHGRVCGLFGPNGSGKTTLFRCCLGFLAPSAGDVRVEGVSVSSLGIADIARRMAYVPQEHRPGFPFSVREIVSMGRSPRMSTFFRLGAEDREKVERSMEIAGIAHLANEPCTTLSGGQRQLAALARAIAQETPLMLLDEPASALDFNNQILVWQALRRIAAQGVAVLICCHDPNHILWFCDDAAILHEGRLVASGPSGETLTPEVLRILYGSNFEVCSVENRPFVRPAPACGR